MSSRIAKEEVLHIAELARLELDEREVETYTLQLGAILDHASAISELDLREVIPMTHPLPLSNVLRDDIIDESLQEADFAKSAPDFEDHRFRVPKILEDSV